mgnify:CR=1 FL=1|jgi:hypothetical protein
MQDAMFGHTFSPTEALRMYHRIDPNMDKDDALFGYFKENWDFTSIKTEEGFKKFMTTVRTLDRAYRSIFV